MNRLATVLGGAALLLAPLASHAQTVTTTSLWERNDANDATNFSATASTERGLAYNSATGNVLLVTNNGGTYRIVPLSGTTGVAGTALTSDPLIVAGGTRTLNDVEVASNGNIIACNLAIATQTFRCYRWDSEADTSPELVVNYTSPARIGDKITVEGNMLYAATSGVVNSSTLQIFDLGGTIPLTAPTSSVTLGGYTGTGNSCDVQPTGTHYYLKCNGLGVQYYDLTGTRVGAIPTTIIASGSNALDYYVTADSSYLFVYQYGNNTTNNNTRIVNTTNFEAAPSTAAVLPAASTPTVYTLTQSSTTNNSNGNGTGDVAIRVDGPNQVTVYTLTTNNGVQAAQTTKSGLPVELVSFTALASGTDAVVRWSTASETNNAAFAIEALRGTAWTEVAAVAGRGTTSERADYETRVSGLGTGRHTLRLVQRDLDGTATVAGTVEVTIGQTEALALSVRSNATDAPMLGVVARESGTAVVTVSDVTGRTVARYAIAAEAGARTDVAVTGLAAGVYVVRASGRTGTAATTLVVR